MHVALSHGLNSVGAGIPHVSLELPHTTCRLPHVQLQLSYVIKTAWQSFHNYAQSRRDNEIRIFGHWIMDKVGLPHPFKNSLTSALNFKNYKHRCNQRRRKQFVCEGSTFRRETPEKYLGLCPHFIRCPHTSQRWLSCRFYPILLSNESISIWERNCLLYCWQCND